MTPLPRRRPLKFAREIVALAQLSNNRFVAGVGIGGDSGGEMTRLGESGDERLRGDQLDEALHILRALWSDESTQFHGDHYKIDEIVFRPRPPEASPIPIWVACVGAAPRAVRRAAEFDGVCSQCDPSTLARLVASLQNIRGSMNDYDVVAKGEPDINPGPWVEAGATWWLTAVPEGATLDTARRVIEAGPPKL